MWGAGARNALGDVVADGSARKAHLLIVEDNIDIRETLELVLSEQGYDVSTASDQSQAFALLEAQVFDLVLTDLYAYTQVDPLQAVSGLREHVVPVPVGLMSGWPVDPAQAKREGFAFLLMKPFDLDELLEHIAASLLA